MAAGVARSRRQERAACLSAGLWLIAVGACEGKASNSASEIGQARKAARQALCWPALSLATITPIVRFRPSVGMHIRPALNKALTNRMPISDFAAGGTQS